MKILHLEANRYSEMAMKQIQSLGEIVIPSPNISQNDLIQLLEEESFHIIFTRLGLYFGKEELTMQPKLKYLVTPTTGLNHIDLDAASASNIEIVSLKGESNFLASIQSTAEHTWTLMLMLARNQIQATKSTLNGQWDRGNHLADELNTRTLGIIGFGRLGKILYQYAKAFQMNVMLHDIDPKAFNEEASQYAVDLKELLLAADYVVLLVDFRPENIKMIDKECFALMKPSAYFINTSRGEMVDESALLEALQLHKIKGAALDVLNGDSSWKTVPENHSLITYANQNKNLLITPHMGGYGRVSILKTRDFIVEKLLNLNNTEKLL